MVLSLSFKTLQASLTFLIPNNSHISCQMYAEKIDYVNSVVYFYICIKKGKSYYQYDLPLVFLNTFIYESELLISVPIS